VLTARPTPYTSVDLVTYGAMVRLPDHAALLLDNVFVAANARLSLGSTALRTLYLDNGSGGFASIVAWGGNLAFHGSASQPMTIIGWDRTVNRPAADSGTGRSYIRDVGGEMTLTDVRASWLGFWSGRTGGIAWTGTSGQPSTGGATGTTFTDSTYGAFVSRGSNVAFGDDLFEFNELDGLHIHRYSVNVSVVDSSASRNGDNGFTVSPATKNVQLISDVSEHNARDGYFFDGRPLATGASASGGEVAPGSGTVLKDSAALGNGQMGVLVEGGIGTVIEGNQVCAQITAVAIRDGVSDGVVTGNDIRCSPRSGLSIGPSTPGLMVSGNTVVDPRDGILVSSSGPIQLDSNDIIGATVFGISARGAASSVTGVGNLISGTGFRAIDARADAAMPTLSSTNASGWAFHERLTVWSYLEFHPLAALWLGIAVLVLLGWAWSHRHRLPSHPYPQTTRWPVTAPEPLAGEAPAVAPAALEPAGMLGTVAAAAAEQPHFAADTTMPLRAVRAEDRPGPPWEREPAGARRVDLWGTGGYRNLPGDSDMTTGQEQPPAWTAAPGWNLAGREGRSRRAASVLSSVEEEEW
jgi:hypothetical protein